MVVAQEIREFRERQRKWTYVIAERAIEGFASMGVNQPEAPKRRHCGRRPR
jgi:hypothetical protein